MVDERFVAALRTLDRREDELVAEFASHPVFGALACSPSAGDPAPLRTFAASVLLQRRFLSLAFTPLYDMVIDGLADAQCKEMAREILQYEYPAGRTSHREDLVSDLLAIGVSRDDVLSAVPSTATQQTLWSLFSAVRKARGENTALFQIRLLSVMRFAGEVLVAEEYRLLWPSLERLGLVADDRAARAPGKTKSVFYYPHWRHDARSSRLAALFAYEHEATTHADGVGAHLVHALEQGPAQGIEHCMRIAASIVSSKRSFYDQFIAAAPEAQWGRASR